MIFRHASIEPLLFYCVLANFILLVHLISNQDKWHIFVSASILEVLSPLLAQIECISILHIINNDAAIGSSIE